MLLFCLESHGCLLPFLSPLLFFSLVLLLFLLMVHSSDFSPKNILIFFVKMWSFCIPLVDEIGGDSWCVVCGVCSLLP